VPGVSFAGLIHPGLIGCLPSRPLLEAWNKRETGFIATNPTRVPGLANPPFGPLVTFLVITLNTAVAFLVLSRSELVQRLLGVNGTRALTRITALPIAAVGVAFVRQGIVEIVKSLA